ncbi:MAG: MFS transporter [Pseudomonadota bacterium]
MPVAFAGFPLYVLAPDYYATQFGLSLSALGFILLGLRIFDAVQDPIIGMMSDHFLRASAWFMPLSAVILCASIYALFNHEPASPALWFALCMSLAVSAYSILSINLNALGALWTKDKNAQTRIATFREGFGLVGLVIAVSTPGILSHFFGKEHAFLWFSVILIVLMTFALFSFRGWQAAHILKGENDDNSPSSLRKTIYTMRGETKKLFTIYAVSMLASSIPAILVLFFTRDLLGAESYTGVFLLLYFCSGAFGMPLWNRLSARYGKSRSWFASILLAVASFFWAFFLESGDIWQYGIICILSGFALGADLTLPPSILADHLHHNKLKHYAATYYSFLALISKASLALASVSVLSLLEGAGFMPAKLNDESALMALSLSYAVLPCLLKVSAGFMLYRFFIHPNQGGHHENNHLNSTYRSSYHV